MNDINLTKFGAHYLKVLLLNLIIYRLIMCTEFSFQDFEPDASAVRILNACYKVTALDR